jgi:hypothetical protein
MKKKHQIFITGALLATIVFLAAQLAQRSHRRRFRRPVIIAPPPPSQPIVERRRQAPEFRDAPIKKYKPGYTQQMGVLLGQDNETLPLYGKTVRGHRDRYHYYTTTNGEQIYPLTISHNGRECTDDIGCPEFYGNEQVSVMSKSGAYNTKLYRTDNFFD